jgi:hypothetical protein
MRTKAPEPVTGANHYRDRAKSLRERASAANLQEARDELQALASEYERLADFVQVGKTPSPQKG